MFKDYLVALFKVACKALRRYAVKNKFLTVFSAVVLLLALVRLFFPSVAGNKGELVVADSGRQPGAEDRRELQASLLHHVPHLLHLPGSRLPLRRALHLPQVWKDLWPTVCLYGSKRPLFLRIFP